MRKSNPAAPRTQPRLPSLDLLKGFEASARLLSFTKAGEELHLSQSAVSRQVQELEDQLGVRLFQRRHRALALTEASRLARCRSRRLLALAHRPSPIPAAAAEGVPPEVVEEKEPVTPGGGTASGGKRRRRRKK